MVCIEFQAFTYMHVSGFGCSHHSSYHCPADTVFGEAQHIPKRGGKTLKFLFSICLEMEILKKTDGVGDSGVVWLNTVILGKMVRQE